MNLFNFVVLYAWCEKDLEVKETLEILGFYFPCFTEEKPTAREVRPLFIVTQWFNVTTQEGPETILPLCVVPEIGGNVSFF